MIPRGLLLRTLRSATTITPSRTLRTVSITRRCALQQPHAIRSASHVSTTPDTLRYMSSSSKSLADETIEEITELYATAQDEFEIAMEETEKVSVYAEDDRKAAREELDRVKGVYDGVVNGEDKELAEEVRRRIGQRMRELEMGVQRMEEMALEQD